MTRRIVPGALALGLAAVAWCAAVAAAAPGRHIVLSGMRFWSAPANTRVVLDFSGVASVVAPDSGYARQLVLSVPADVISRATSVPRVMGVADGVVDSVEAVPLGPGMQFRLWFRDTTRFQVFSLSAEDEKPFRIVIDVARPGGEAAVEQRWAGIAATKTRERVRIVAVDPGHGGEDTGARGPHRVVEKQVTLAVARELVEELNKTPGIHAALTRDGDYFVPLRERYRAAERMKADVFISIHANSSRRRGAGRGTEVYFLSLRGAGDQADADLADLENAADLVGGIPVHAEDELVNILYDVKRSSALQQSQLLAETLLDHIAADRRLESRGVKQAGFVVLKSVEFPSVLVETAFINNPVEARLLRDPDFQKQISHQLSEGVRTYFKRAGIRLGSASETAGGASSR